MSHQAYRWCRQTPDCGKAEGRRVQRHPASFCSLRTDEDGTDGRTRLDFPELGVSFLPP